MWAQPAILTAGCSELGAFDLLFSGWKAQHRGFWESLSALGTKESGSCFLRGFISGLCFLSCGLCDYVLHFPVALTELCCFPLILLLSPPCVCFWSKITTSSFWSFFPLHTLGPRLSLTTAGCSLGSRVRSTHSVHPACGAVSVPEWEGRTSPAFADLGGGGERSTVWDMK